jgi:hypothetical protein
MLSTTGDVKDKVKLRYGHPHTTGYLTGAGAPR